MKFKYLLPLGLATLLSAATPVLAQGAGDTFNASDISDERIIVTGLRASESVPGITLTRKADFLLLEVTLINDSLEEDQRRKELLQTLGNLMDRAKRERGIDVSLIDEEGFVLALEQGGQQTAIQPAENRRDTSLLEIRLKTEIPKDASSGQALVARLRQFASSIKKVGRTLINDTGDVDISIVNPSQYRAPLIALIADDIKQVTESLGDGYRVTLNGMSERLRWHRVGVLDVSLYIPYSYTVIPDSIESYTDMTDY